MLAKKYRLPTSFFGVNASGKRILLASRQLNELNFKTFFSPLPYSRFAVVAPLSVFKKSSERNKYRRTIYEAIRKLGLNTEQGKNTVIYLKAEIKKISRKEIEELVGKLLKK